MHTPPVTANAKVINGRRVRWNEEFARAAYADGWWRRDTLADAIRNAARDTPERIAVVDGPLRLDCRTWYSDASALAQSMLERLAVGSVVSMMLPNWHEAAIIYVAATLAGMVVHPVLPSLRERDLAFALADIDSRMIFIPGALQYHDYNAMLRQLLAKLPRPPHVVVVRGDPQEFIDFASMRHWQSSTALPTLDPDAVCMVIYTSGTTGTPKGVMHSHNSIGAVIRQIGVYWHIEPGDAFLVASPISHIGGSLYAFECPLLLGTRAVLMERWDADTAVAMLIAEHCTHTAGATPFLTQLLAAAQRAGTRLPDLKAFFCGGASVPPSLIRQAAAYFAGAAVTRVYGSTEVPVITVGTPDVGDVAHAADTDGRVGVATVKLTDAAGAPAASGEICVRGPQMLVGYLHSGDEVDAFDAEGYFRSGDLGRWCGHYLAISGRLKDTIIRNGENISPKEVEDLLLGHPDIAEIAVVGLPDARTGERACAVIVSQRRPALDVEDLRAYLKSQGVAAFKIPEQVIAWTSLPKNDAGKILKARVRALLMEQTQKG